MRVAHELLRRYILMQDSDAEGDASDGEGGEPDDGTAAAAAAKGRSRSKKSKKQNASWLRCSPGMALMLLVLLMVSAQIFMIFEQLSHSVS